MANYTLQFVTNGDTEMSPQEIDSTTLFSRICRTIPVPRREGYDFVGWYAASDLMYAVHGYSPDGYITKNTTLWARWMPHETGYTWYLNTNNRGGSPTYSQTYKQNYMFTPCQIYLLQGKTINCVRLKMFKAGTISLRVIKLTGENTYTEVVTKKRVLDFSQSPEREDVILEFSPIQIENDEIVAFGDPDNDTGLIQQVSAGGPTDGNVFAQILHPSQDVRYFAMSLDMDIGYKGQISDGNPVTEVSLNFKTKTLNINGTFTLIASVLPTDADDKTILWSVEDDSNVISIDPGLNSECVVHAVSTGSAVVKARSSNGIEQTCTVTVNNKHEYSATFESNGGTSIPGISFTGESPTIRLPEPTKTDNVFVGWFDNEDMIGNVVTTIQPHEQTTDIRLYAKWISKSLHDYFFGKTVTVMGDSITTYYEDMPNISQFDPHYSADVCQQYGITRDTTWWGQIIQATGMQLKTLDATNYGCVATVPGIQRYRMCANYENMINTIGLNGDPDVVMIMIGTNDLYYYETPDKVSVFDPEAEYVVGELDKTSTEFLDFTEAYVTMIRRIQDKYPQTEIIIFTPYLGTQEAKNAIISKAALQMKSICDHYNLKFVDNTQSEMKIGMYNGKLYTIDGIVHPANYGFKVLADYGISELGRQINAVPYLHMTKDGVKIRVDSAIRDGYGRKIETNYVRTVNGKKPVDGNVVVDIPESNNMKVLVSEDGGETFASVDEVKLINISENEYNELVKSGNVLSNAIYEVDYENSNCFGERLINVGGPVDDSDAATKQYVDSKTSSIKVPTKVSELTNDSGFLTAHQSLDNYYDKIQVNEISANLAGKSAVRLSIPESNVRKDLSVLNIVKLTQTRYDQMQQDGSILSDHLYIVQQDDDGILFGGNSFTC